MSNVIDFSEKKEEIKNVETKTNEVQDKIEIPNVNEVLPEEVKEETTETIEAVVNPYTSNIVESVVSKENDYKEIFTDTFNSMKTLTQTKSISASINNDLKKISKYASGTELTDEVVKSICDRFRSLNKDEKMLSNDELDFILGNSKINKDSIGVKTDEELYEFIKGYVSLIIASEHSTDIFNQAQDELAKLNANFKVELDELLGSLDLSLELEKTMVQIEKEEDPEKKKILQTKYNGLYASVNLNMILDKIENKGLSIIKKECKRNFEKARDKFFRILNNDKTANYLNPSKLEETLQTAFPEVDNEKIRILLYTIYISINKRKTIDTTTSIFINYFILNTNKLVTKGFEEFKDQNVFYNNLNKFFSTL